MAVSRTPPSSRSSISSGLSCEASHSARAAARRRPFSSIGSLSASISERTSCRAVRCDKFGPLGPNLSHLTARQEVRSLIDALKLPIDEKGRRRAAARAEWLASQDKPLEIDDLLDGGVRDTAIAPRGQDATL